MRHVLRFRKFLVAIFIISFVFFSFNILLQWNQQKKQMQQSQTQTEMAQQNVLAGTTTGCFNGGWNARKKITFNFSITTGTTLTNFPVLVKLDSSRINYSKTLANGADIRFEDPSSPGTFLPYEIETWNPSGTSYIWVRVPQLDASTSDYIWMYYNNPSATDGQQRNAVWEDSFKGVWHLGSIFYDSTSNGNNGTNYNTTSSEGLMGNASNFAGTNTANQYIAVPNSSSLNFGTTQNFTIEAWVKLPSDQNYKTYPDNDIISKWTHDTSPPVNPYPYNLRTTNSSSGGGAGEIYSNRYDANGTNPNCSSLPSKFNNNSWLHIATVKNGNTLSMYINGSSVCSVTDTTATTTTNSDPLHFGRRVNERNWLTGSIDEVRISSTNRSATWIQAAYSTGRDGMNSFGSEEVCQITAPTTLPSPTPSKTPTPTPYKTPTPTPYKTPTPVPAQTSTSTTTQTYTTSTQYQTQSLHVGGVASDPVSTTQTYQTSNYQTTTTSLAVDTPTGQNLDRLAVLDQTTVKCINSLLTPEEQDKLRYLQPTIPSEEALLKTLQDKVAVCFQTYTEVVKIQEASKIISELPDGTKQCVVSAIGLPAYEQIQSGQRQPTTEEKASTKSCFEKQAAPQIVYQTKDAPLNSGTDSCLVLALGNDRYSAIKTLGKPPTVEEREKINRCFGANPNPLTSKPKYTVPAEIDTCIKQNLSEARYFTIRSGMQEPTDEEKTKANQCFAKLNQDQTKFLPAPPVQVPYLKTDPSSVKIHAVAPTTETTTNVKKDNAVLLRGKSLPNSMVDIYVFSDPIVVETTTDQNGDWVYKLNEPLEQGSHLAYATVRSASGEQVRSSVFNFNVAVAVGPSQALAQQYFAENNASSVPSKFFDSSLIMIGGALLLGVIITLIAILQSQQPKVVPSTNGQSNSENTSRPVN